MVSCHVLQYTKQKRCDQGGTACYRDTWWLYTWHHACAHSRCRIIFLFLFSAIILQWSSFVCLHSSFVSVLFTGLYPYLNKVFFRRRLVPSYLSIASGCVMVVDTLAAHGMCTGFIEWIGFRKWDQNLSILFDGKQLRTGNGRQESSGKRAF